MYNESCLFEKWQPIYAEHGIATFPVKDKKPSIKGYQNIGLRGSTQLATKFGGSNAFGFMCGKRSRITILDIDSSHTGDVQEAIKLFGESPVLWRTGSGNHAMAFRFNGEGRHIRPIDGVPLDLLGGGLSRILCRGSLLSVR